MNLKDLLAVIHRDGGHYTEKHGVEKSFEDAVKLHIKYRDFYNKKNGVA